ncbi:MAG TPA: hypothetical protein VMG11_05360 [Steroidobacteraceae bacterium]|nr:hypothetical protein [Steroidobacteraceae bacterium]
MPERSDAEMGRLRTRARERIQEGKLPRTKPVRTWGGLGTGLPCDLCELPIQSNEPEFELQLDVSAPGDAVRFHRECHAIWESVRAESAPDAAEQWTSVSRALPALGELVEGRVSLSDSRSLVLTLKWMRDSETGALLWVNATTMAPLPEGWLPSAWRHYVAGQTQSQPEAADAATVQQTSIPKRA